MITIIAVTATVFNLLVYAFLLAAIATNDRKRSDQFALIAAWFIFGVLLCAAAALLIVGGAPA